MPTARFPLPCLAASPSSQRALNRCHPFLLGVGERRMILPLSNFQLRDIAAHRRVDLKADGILGLPPSAEFDLAATLKRRITRVPCAVALNTKAYGLHNSWPSPKRKLSFSLSAFVQRPSGLNLLLCRLAHVVVATDFMQPRLRMRLLYTSLAGS